MNLLTIIIKSIKYYWRQNLALLIGTIISTAVLTGALIIGDSVRSSLIHLVDLRLGKTEFALVSGDRFVRSDLALEIGKDLHIKTAPILFTQGISINTDNRSRINKTDILGIDDNFWTLSDSKSIHLDNDEAIINANIASRLDLKVDDELLIRLEKPSIIPLNAPFVAEENQTQSLRLKIKAIVDDEQMGRFSLKSNQAEPYNVFVSRKYLASELDLAGLSNIILASNDENNNLQKDDLDQYLAQHWKLQDLSLQINTLPELNEFEVISDRIFIDYAIAHAIEKIEMPHQAALTYLINEMESKGKTTPYSFASALPIKDLKNNEVIINQWLADDIKAQIGDTLHMKYYIVGPLRKLIEDSTQFIIKEIVPTESALSNPSLMPSFPGLADAGSCSDWETGVPIDLEKIRDKDEQYWDEFRGTPKAFIALAKGATIWDNNYGKTTSIRFNQDEISQEKLTAELKKVLHPELAGLRFLPVKNEGVKAAKNMVDFGGLFLSLSFFIIAAGLLLTFLIYSFNTQTRSKESGILSGMGFKQNEIFKIRLGESVLVIVVGGIIGAFLGIAYNYGILAGINTIWKDVVRTNMIDVYIFPGTMLLSVIIGVLLSLGTVYFVTRKSLKQHIADAVRRTSNYSPAIRIGKNKYALFLAILAYIITLVIVVVSLYHSIEQNAMAYLSAGGIFLLGSIALLHYFFTVKSNDHLHTVSLSALAVKNMRRNKNRSIATIILLAIGTFSVIITGANRKSFHGAENYRKSGTGGFSYWTEFTVPLLNDLSTSEGQEELGIQGEPAFENIDFVQMHLFDGDDASCLNLNQVKKPKILGIDAHYFQEREAFTISKKIERVPNDKLWLELKKNYGENTIPVIADQTVIQWSLLKSVGDTLYYTNENGNELKLVLIAGLGASIFQGHILMAKTHFVKHFPSVSGSKVMLVDAPLDVTIEENLKFYFQDYGIELQKASQRLLEFYSVTNSYLSIFLALGALGIIIGTIGLGILILRNIMERKAELALLLATGIKKSDLFRMIFMENFSLFVLGLIIGIVSALIGILPSILSPAFTMPAGFIGIIIFLILISGLFWIYFPARIALSGQLIANLREE